MGCLHDDISAIFSSKAFHNRTYVRMIRVVAKLRINNKRPINLECLFSGIIQSHQRITELQVNYNSGNS